MAKDIKKEPKECPSEKNAEVKGGSKSSCGCGCSLLTKKK